MKKLQAHLADKTLHKVLFVIIATLIIINIYFGSSIIMLGKSEYASFFSDKHLSSEQSLQDKTAEVSPNSIHVPIFIYHSVRPHLPVETPVLKRYTVSPQSFEQQLKYLKENGYTVVSFSYLIEALKKNTIIPPKSVVLTFDDGWHNQFLYAFPVLKKYDDTATFFVFTNSINRHNFLSWEELAQMSQAGMTIGGHTKSHPYLIGITDEKILKNEIAGGKETLEKALGHKVNLFAYPFGQYNDKIIKIVEEAGYIAARSTYRGTKNSIDDIYKLRGVEATDDFSQFRNNLGE